MNTYTCWKEGEEDDDAITVQAYDPEHAAEEWAQRVDDDEYTIAGGTWVVCVVQDAKGERTRWLVRGECVPQYSATVAKPLCTCGRPHHDHHYVGPGKRACPGSYRDGDYTRFYQETP